MVSGQHPVAAGVATAYVQQAEVKRARQEGHHAVLPRLRQINHRAKGSTEWRPKADRRWSESDGEAIQMTLLMSTSPQWSRPLSVEHESVERSVEDRLPRTDISWRTNGLASLLFESNGVSLLLFKQCPYSAFRLIYI